MTKGFLLVIEGSDGSGKATQVELLSETLKEKGIPFIVFDFPRYEDNVYGELIKRYLNGEFGDKVSPYLASLPFAMDRFLAKPQIEKALSEGKVVLCNRYSASNKAHMAANLPESERDRFMKWLGRVEYEINQLPLPDLTIFLNVPPEIGQKNIEGEKDIHEASFRHLEEANKIYQDLARTEPNWKVLECTEGGQMQSPVVIHQRVVKIVNPFILP